MGYGTTGGKSHQLLCQNQCGGHRSDDWGYENRRRTPFQKSYHRFKKRSPVDEPRLGDEVGIKVKERVRENDVVHKFLNR